VDVTIPLSFVQRRMWLLHQLERRAAAYPITAAFRLAGSLDQAALAATITPARSTSCCR
jgi:hypothetical protein